MHFVVGRVLAKRERKMENSNNTLEQVNLRMCLIHLSWLKCLVMTLVCLLLVGCTINPNHFNFKTFTPYPFPNNYLVCPRNYCHIAPNEISPVYAISIVKLQQSLNILLSKQSRITMIHTDNKRYEYVFIERTPLLHFPDYVAIKLIPLKNKQSTVAIYSQSKYGLFDFGRNSFRVQTLLQKLSKTVKKTR